MITVNHPLGLKTYTPEQLQSELEDLDFLRDAFLVILNPEMVEGTDVPYRKEEVLKLAEEMYLNRTTYSNEFIRDCFGSSEPKHDAENFTKRIFDAVVADLTTFSRGGGSVRGLSIELKGVIPIKDGERLDDPCWPPTDTMEVKFEYVEGYAFPFEVPAEEFIIQMLKDYPEADTIEVQYDFEEPYSGPIEGPSITFKRI